MSIEQLLVEALAHYDIAEPQVEFIRHNENATYKVVDASAERIVRGYEEATGVSVEDKFIEPFLAMQILLFIATHYENARRREWFGDGVSRWCNEVLVPLIE